MFKMFRFLYLIVCIFGACAQEKSIQNYENRIIGGIDAKPGEIPYIVSVKRYAQHICGGSILSAKYVLTAAHCVHGFEDKPKMHAIQYSITSLQETGNYIVVEQIFKHEDYQSIVSHPNDVAILKLTKDINMNVVKAIKLPTTHPDTNPRAILAGWGKMENEQNSITLKKVDVTLFDDKTCKQYVFGYDTKYHTCAGDLAGGHGQCQGDSGGPLVVDDIQYGIVSFSTKPCASPKKPGVFARVINYIQWIKAHSDLK